MVVHHEAITVNVCLYSPPSRKSWEKPTFSEFRITAVNWKVRGMHSVCTIRPDHFMKTIHIIVCSEQQKTEML